MDTYKSSFNNEPLDETNNEELESTRPGLKSRFLHPPLFGDRNNLQDGLFEYEEDAPTNDADILLKTPIMRPPHSSLVLQRFSQTPLSPENLIDMGFAYPRAFHGALHERVIEATAQKGLRDPYTEAILREVQEEHYRRIKGNTRAAERLQEVIHGKTLSDEEAALIWRARTGDATVAETAKLLLRYPAMLSIEAAKYTQPLDWNSMTNIDAYIHSGLGEFGKHMLRPSEMQFVLYGNKDERRDFRYINITENIEANSHLLKQNLIIGIKDNIAEVSNGTTQLQLVRKQTMIMLPPHLELEDSVRRDTMIKGTPVNVQSIAISCYWRIKPEQA